MHRMQPGGLTIRQVKLLRYITAPQDALKRLVLQVAEWLTASLSESQQLCWGDGDVGMCLMHKKQPGGLTIRDKEKFSDISRNSLFCLNQQRQTTKVVDSDDL